MCIRDSLGDLRERRNATAVSLALDQLRDAATGSKNLMPPLLESVRVYATLGEICDVLREVWGEYEEATSI